MFTTPNVHVFFRKAALKIEHQGDTEARVAELTFVIDPLLPALAHELGEDVAGHCFDGPAHAVRDEFIEATLLPRCGLQRVIVRMHEDLDLECVLRHVRLRGLKLTRVQPTPEEKPVVRLAMVLSVDLAERVVRDFVINRFGSLLAVTFNAEQGELPLERETVTVSAGGESVTTTPENLRRAAREVRGRAARAMRRRRSAPRKAKRA